MAAGLVNGFPHVDFSVIATQTPKQSRSVLSSLFVASCGVLDAIVYVNFYDKLKPKTSTLFY
jgi:hypothetical protein